MGRRFRFSYQSIEQYKVMVRNYHFMLRCTPRSEPFQHCEELNLRLLTGVKINMSTDCFGNAIHYGSLDEEHDLFVISMSGVIECDHYQIADAKPQVIYTIQSHFTHPNTAIKQLGESVETTGCTPLEEALRLSAKVYESLEYRSQVTTVSTTASELIELGVGVCQDYSHLLLSLCRLRGIHSRYVMGYVMGEGETHAWVEVWSDGVWYGIDPTHNTLVKEGFIKVAHGRDAADCSVVRGMRRGVSSTLSNVRVVVEEIY